MNEEFEYGYIEGGTLVSRFLSEQREVTTDEEGNNHVRIIAVEEQAAALSDEWKPVDPIDTDIVESGGDDFIVVPVAYDAGDHIAYHYVKKFDTQRVRREIQTLKDALTASDYQVTKCYEASLTGLPLPYDIAALHSERQAQRDKINELEARLEEKPENVILL